MLELSGDETGAIHRAARHDHCAMLQILLDAGVYVDGLDGRGRTALCCAAKEGHIAAVRLLLNANANPNTQDYENMTALDWAFIHRHSAVFQSLIAAGACSTLQDTNDLTAALHTGPELPIARIPIYHNKDATIAAQWPAFLKQTQGTKATRLNRTDVEKNRKKIDMNVKLTDLAKFSKDFKMLTPIPKDLVPILSNDKAKQMEIVDKAKRLSEGVDAKAGIFALYQPSTKVPDPKAKSFGYPPFNTRPQAPTYHTANFPSSSGHVHDQARQVSTNWRSLRNPNGNGVENLGTFTQPLSVPFPIPKPSSYSQALRRGIIDGRQ